MKKILQAKQKIRKKTNKFLETMEEVKKQKNNLDQIEKNAIEELIASLESINDSFDDDEPTGKTSGFLQTIWRGPAYKNKFYINPPLDARKNHRDSQLEEKLDNHTRVNDGYTNKEDCSNRVENRTAPVS